MIAFVVIGLLAFSGTGDCLITKWTTPVHETAGGVVATAILTKAEGYTGDFITFVAVTDQTSITGYTIFSQVPASIFAVSTTGVLTLAANQVLDYETAQTSVLQIVASDSTATPAVGTVTVTISITNVAPTFAATTQTVNVAEAAAASTTVTTLTATDVGATGATLTYAITAASNTNTDFAISSAGVVTTLNALASATTASYALVITAADSQATILTGTTTLTVCVGCGAAGLAAGVLSLITLAMTMLK